MPADDRNDEDARPPRARRPRDDREDDEDDRPRRRRRRDDDQDGDATGGLIPYKNGMALAAYYCSVASLIPILGLVLGILAVIFGIFGVRHRNRRPAHGGMAHSIVGIVLGSLTALANWIVAILLIAGGFK